MATILAGHFTKEEYEFSETAVRHNISNLIPPELIPVAIALHQELLIVERVLNCDMLQTSGYRCDAVNKLVGGVPGSAHGWAGAKDFVMPKLGTPWDICIQLKQQAIKFPSSFNFDQIIFEYGRWCHYGIKPRHVGNRQQFLTVDHFGTREGLWAIRQ